MDHTVVDQDTADHQQACYFRDLLGEHRREVDRRIAGYQSSMTRHAARGNIEDARRVRRMLRVEERQRQTLTRLLENLDRRFAPLCEELSAELSAQQHAQSNAQHGAEPPRPAPRRSGTGTGTSRPSLAIMTRQAVPT